MQPSWVLHTLHIYTYMLPFFYRFLSILNSASDSQEINQILIRPHPRKPNNYTLPVLEVIIHYKIKKVLECVLFAHREINFDKTTSL